MYYLLHLSEQDTGLTSFLEQTPSRGLGWWKRHSQPSLPYPQLQSHWFTGSMVGHSQPKSVVFVLESSGAPVNQTQAHAYLTRITHSDTNIPPNNSYVKRTCKMMYPDLAVLCITSTKHLLDTMFIRVMKTFLRAKGFFSLLLVLQQPHRSITSRKLVGIGYYGQPIVKQVIDPATQSSMGTW